MDFWIEFIRVVGIPAATLAAMMWGMYRGGKWLGNWFTEKYSKDQDESFKKITGEVTTGFAGIDKSIQQWIDHQKELSDQREKIAKELIETFTQSYNNLHSIVEIHEKRIDDLEDGHRDHEKQIKTIKNKQDDR